VARAVCHELLAIEHLEHRECGGGRHRIAAKGEKEAEFRLECLDHRPIGITRPWIAIRDRLSQGHDVGGDSRERQFRGARIPKNAIRNAEPVLNLISHDQAPGGAYPRRHRPRPSRGRIVNAAAGQRLSMKNAAGAKSARCEGLYRKVNILVAARDRPGPWTRPRSTPRGAVKSPRAIDGTEAASSAAPRP